MMHYVYPSDEWRVFFVFSSPTNSRKPPRNEKSTMSTTVAKQDTPREATTAGTGAGSEAAASANPTPSARGAGAAGWAG